ncbi:MAG: heparinase II/III-family protein [Lachnospiraceae bacterium]|nr:heparinase II/III-family protein [Lachnospiraceae bacterium]MCM1215635.1 heparinase II/III-family protein [Lachnospiraceae bacterium]MCM1238495.1 heparinase II/III-family protein [Lachnospiraceae bacterium]MCM1343875.1 heparinase II/III-family protein [Muribaculaceae bacterium]
MEKRFLNAMEHFWEKNDRLRDFRPFPDIDDRKAYEGLPLKLRRDLIEQGEAYLGYGYPVIRATDFMDFKRTGNRVDFETRYFERRYALNALTAAECAEDKGRFLDDIINGIFAICEESAWQLPPHNTYIRNAPQEILPDVTRPVLDLFACETGAQLACVRYLLGSRLDRISPFINTRIAYELERRILIPYVHEHFWWMGKDEEPMCNWTPWCTQNVLLAVFLRRALPGTEKAVTLKAAESLDYFLKDYGEDGCCDEGAQYFRHAGLCLDGATDILNRITSGAFEGLYAWDKVKNIASYIFHVHVNDRYYINFADCSPVAGRAGVREFLFGRRTSQPELMLFAARDLKAAQGDIFADESNRLNLFYRMQAIFHYQEIMDYDTSRTPLHQDIYYPSVGLFLSRNDTFCLAVKAGDNDDSHNHNDTGSFTLYKNGRPLFVDIGVESYTAKTFSSRRYEIWTMQSCYHNLPTIEGLDQRDGKEYRATEVETAFHDTESSISMELSGAYPLKTCKKHYTRRIFFDKLKSSILLKDATDAGNVVLNFITYEKPLVTDDHIEIGDLAQAGFSGAKPIAVEVLPITDARLRTAWDHDLYRIRLAMTAAEFQLEIK